MTPISVQTPRVFTNWSIAKDITDSGQIDVAPRQSVETGIVPFVINRVVRDQYMAAGDSGPTEILNTGRIGKVVGEYRSFDEED